MTADRADITGPLARRARAGRRARATSMRPHLQVLAYGSFRHAQGNQAGQLHFVQAYVRLLAQQGIPFERSGMGILDAIVGHLRLPHGHADINDPVLVRAQFAFWARNIWDVIRSVYHDAPDLLPDRRRLDQRAAEVGGTREMTSFTDDELAALAAAFAYYRAPSSIRLSATDIVDTHLVPALLETELGFQGEGTRFVRRPRTDGGDVHESRMLGHCRKAAQRYRDGRPDVVNQIYRAVCARLDRAVDDADPLASRYRDLVAAYNRCHPASALVRLHVPEDSFSERRPGGERE